MVNKNCKIKNPYYRKAGLWEWRRKLIKSANLARYRRKYLLPKYRDPYEQPIKGVGNIWEFKADELSLSLKKLKLYSKLLTKLHLQDAIDWLNALSNVKLNKILNSLSDSQKKIFEEYNGDPSRLYIDNITINYGTPIKSIKYHSLGNYGIMCKWRNSLVYKIREMPMNEFYHKIFVLGKIPKSMGVEMRNAINDHRVPLQTITEWYPYLTAHTRFFYRKKLRWLNDNGKFNYYKHRREWIDLYNTNLQRRVNELRLQRL